MDVLDGRDELRSVELDTILLEAFFLTKTKEKVPSLNEGHNKVDAFFVMEGPLQIDEVGVMEQLK